jgi:hypothetical protein
MTSVDARNFSTDAIGECRYSEEQEGDDEVEMEEVPQALPLVKNGNRLEKYRRVGFSA